jgi:hypothetical protein
MIGAIIVWCGSWYAATKIKNGWWLILVVPLLASAAGVLAYIARVQILHQGVGVGFADAIVNISWGTTIGGIIAVLVRWRMWLRRRREAQQVSPSK